jgi:hypothetical protein
MPETLVHPNAGGRSTSAQDIMVLMPVPQQQPIDVTPSEEVVEFGPSRPPRRRWSGGSELLRGLAADRRAVPLAAAVAAVAFFASLVSEWQVTLVDRSFFGSGVGDVSVTTQPADLGAQGTGYMIGLFLLVIATVLALFGPPAVRRSARLAGLGVGGTMLALLVALGVSLGDDSRMVPRVYTDSSQADQVHVAYGRGLWCAIAATLLTLLALFLAGRHVPAEPATGVVEEEQAAVWSWRRAPGETVEPDLEEPLELTVTSAKPFDPAVDDRDRA